jgi:hypothetical protein
VTGRKPQRRYRKEPPALRDKCPSGKVAFKNWDAANRAVHRMNAERHYRCTDCGFYHVTQRTIEQFDAGQARFNSRDTPEEQPVLDTPSSPVVGWSLVARSVGFDREETS